MFGQTKFGFLSPKFFFTSFCESIKVSTKWMNRECRECWLWRVL